MKPASRMRVNIEAPYGRVKSAHAVVQTSEPKLYANMILRKGVIYPVA